MSEALIEDLIMAQEAFLAALDDDGAPGIEQALADFRTSLAAVQAVRGFTPSEATRARLARALALADAARIRTNYLADRTRRQIDRLSAANRGLSAPIAYGRNGRLARR